MNPCEETLKDAYGVADKFRDVVILAEMVDGKLGIFSPDSGSNLAKLVKKFIAAVDKEAATRIQKVKFF